jgi:hypothetical protein
MEQRLPSDFINNSITQNTINSTTSCYRSLKTTVMMLFFKTFTTLPLVICVSDEEMRRIMNQLMMPDLGWFVNGFFVSFQHFYYEMFIFTKKSNEHQPKPPTIRTLSTPTQSPKTTAALQCLRRRRESSSFTLSF